MTTLAEITEWKRGKWSNSFYAFQAHMSNEEIKEAIQYLRDNHYPRPADCTTDIMHDCKDYRRACRLKICFVAVKLCGDI